MVQLYHAALDMPSYLSRGMEMGVHNFKWTNIILKQMVSCIKIQVDYYVSCIKIQVDYYVSCIKIQVDYYDHR